MNKWRLCPNNYLCNKAVLNYHVNYCSIAPYGAYSGDRVVVRFDADEYFEARGVGSSSTNLTQTTNNQDVVSEAMVVVGNFPTFIPDTYINTYLHNGTIEIGRWKEVAQEGSTHISDGKKTIMINIIDSIPTSALLSLSNFTIYEGSTYANATPLTSATSGTDAYKVWWADSVDLSLPTGVLEYDPDSLSFQVSIVYYDARLVPAGEEMCFRFLATAQNVNTGAGSFDMISSYLATDNYDQGTLFADFSPEFPNVWAVLDDGPDLNGQEFSANNIWSEMTGINGNGVFSQSLYGGGGTSSKDWRNGFGVSGLGLVSLRVLTSAGDGTDCGLNGEGEHIELPTEFTIGNAPNPFNAITQISFALPEPTNVILVIYDITGREVASLVDGYCFAGEHSVNFDASALSSGIYFYHIMAGDYSATKKMMLVK